MTTIKYRNWEIVVDKELTEKEYLSENAIAGSLSCGCNNCKNFAANYNKNYPEEIRALFKDLGIDPKKEAEISHFDRLENGLHYYSGWFHFKGSFTGKDCSVSLASGGYTLDLTPITEQFNIGFRIGNALTFFENKENLVQIEFDLTIPWIIDKELEVIT